MSYTAEFIGGPLDGVRSLVTNPPLAADRVWGGRCFRRCRLARLLDTELAPAAEKECLDQRCHVFTADPAGFGFEGAARYRRTGTKKNVHQYEVDDGALDPGGAIYSEPKRAPAAA